MMIKILTAVLGVLLFFLQIKLWFGEGGISDRWQLQQRIDARQAENEAQIEINRQLTAEVKDLKAGSSAIEEHARTELGMIKKGETFFQVVLPERLIQQSDKPQ